MSLLSSLTNRIFLASSLLAVLTIGVAVFRVNVAVTRQAEPPPRIILIGATHIAQLKNAAALLFKNLGCLPCTSGFDVLFRNTIRTLTLDEKLNVKQFGKGF